MKQDSKIGVISDTHVRSFEELPEALVKALAECDLIIHAGDIINMKVIRGLEDLAPVIAVHGNMDQPEVWSALPDRRIIEAAGRKIGVVHGSGGPEEVWKRVKTLFSEVDIIIFGHTHEPMNKSVDGVLLFNPGRASQSYGIIEIGEAMKGWIRRNYY